MGGLVGRTLDRYEIVRLLGAGGMGWVYRARDTSLKRDVALKVLSETADDDTHRQQRFDREIRAVARLSHPNIVEIYDYGRAEGVSYAVMELLRGRDLRQYMGGKPLPIERAIDIGVAIANGLGAAHHEGILHRDIKPANIFITSAGDVKILDFGLVRYLETANSDSETKIDETSLTSPGAVVGTSGYMSPEQVRGRPVDERSDIFSLGCVLFEMLSGTSPFRRETRADTMSATLTDRPPSLTELRPTLAPAVALIVARCLEPDPNDRFEAARDVAFALQTLSGDRPVRSRHVGPRFLAQGRALRYTALAGGVVVTLAMASWMATRPPTDGLPPLYDSHRLTNAPGWETDPAVSPDGSQVAYSSNESGNPDVWMVDVANSVPLRLTTDPGDDHSPAWFPDGSMIAFVSDRGGQPGIWRIPRLGGLAVPLIENGIDPAISPDGTRIAFATSTAAGSTRIAVASLDRTDDPVILTGDDDGFMGHRSPAWSPDGETLCYSDFRNLWLVPAAGGPASRLTDDQARDRFPVWTNDGSFIFFSSARRGTQAIWRISARGGEAQRVTFGTGPEARPSLSRDGSRLAYTTHREELELTVLDRTTKRRHHMTGSRDLTLPALAPDGSAVAFASEMGGQYDLWFVRLRDGEPVEDPRRLTDHPVTVATPSFSPDGRWIAYFGVLDGQRDVWTLALDGGAPRRFTDNPAADVHPAFSPDGGHLAFSSDRSGGRYHVWVAPIAGGVPTGDAIPVTSGESNDLYPTWSPDGRTLAYVRTQGGETEVWTTGLDPEAPPRQLTHGAEARCARWDALRGGLLVSGRWGTGRVELRMVSDTTGESSTLDPPVESDDADGAGLFSTTADGRLLAYYDASFLGDVWLTDLRRASGSRS